VSAPRPRQGSLDAADDARLAAVRWRRPELAGVRYGPSSPCPICSKAAPECRGVILRRGSRPGTLWARCSEPGLAGSLPYCAHSRGWLHRLEAAACGCGVDHRPVRTPCVSTPPPSWLLRSTSTSHADRLDELAAVPPGIAVVVTQHEVDAVQLRELGLRAVSWPAGVDPVPLRRRRHVVIVTTSGERSNQGGWVEQLAAAVDTGGGVDVRVAELDGPQHHRRRPSKSRPPTSMAPLAVADQESQLGHWLASHTLRELVVALQTGRPW
jgi:hypothetical protein